MYWTPQIRELNSGAWKPCWQLISYHITYHYYHYQYCHVCVYIYIYIYIYSLF